jgi:hypothetical protein
MGYSVVLFLNRCSSSRSQAALGTAAASPHLTEYGLPLALLSVAARSMKLSAFVTMLFFSRYSYF